MKTMYVIKPLLYLTAFLPAPLVGLHAAQPTPAGPDVRNVIDGAIHRLRPRRHGPVLGLGDVEERLLGAVQNHIGALFGLVAPALGTTRTVNHAAQQVLLAHDVDVELGVRRRGR